MRKLKRKAVIREVLEARLEKNQRRIQRISEESYNLRLSLEQLDAQKITPITVAPSTEPVPETKEAPHAIS